MKRLIAMLSVVACLLSMTSCSVLDDINSNRAEESRKIEESIRIEESMELEYYKAAQDFYGKIVESVALIDVIATDVCSVWRDADYDDSTEKINKSIQKALSKHQEKIDAVKALDVEIQSYYESARVSVVSTKVVRVMTLYIEYRDSIFDANAALKTFGYMDISSNKEWLDEALRELYVLL